MVVDPNPVEAGVFTARDERRDVRQRQADRNPEGDTEPGHGGNSFWAFIMLHPRDDQGLVCCQITRLSARTDSSARDSPSSSQKISVLCSPISGARREIRQGESP